MKKPLSAHGITQLVLLLAVVLTAAGMAGFIYGGVFARYLADDYCYDFTFNRPDFWQAQVDAYLHVTYFAANRFTLTLFASLGALMGTVSAQVFPGLFVILFAAGCLWTVYGAAKAARIPLTWPEMLLAGWVVPFFALLLAPNRYQILYWRAGMLPYQAPLAFMALIAGGILWGVRRRFSRKWMLPLATLLALITAGFSETGAALLLGFALLGGIVAYWRKKRGSELAAQLVPFSLALILGALMAIVVMLLCPTNLPRMTAGQRQTYNPILLVVLSARFSLDFIRDSLKGLPLPTLAYLGMFLALSFTVGRRLNRTLSGKTTLISAGMGLLGGFGLVMCTIAPSVLAQSSFPELRALLITRLVLLLTYAWVAGIAGLWAAGWSSRTKDGRIAAGFSLAGLAILALVCLYLLRANSNVYGEIPAFQKRAAAWDARDLQIRQFKAQGVQDIQVKGIDSIARIFELQKEPGHWVNVCAARYYQVGSIRTDQ